tara:strand:- start:4128 stop:5099 length:972 start_codon:yes stop_codon:yes gene_type:complete
MADNTKPPAFKQEPHNGKVSMYSKGSRELFTRERQNLVISHVPTGHKIAFPAFLDMLSDAYNSNWNAEDVYGRMDPIATFMNTRRALAVAWHVPADSFEHAQENLWKVNQLMSFLYPLYDESNGGGATVINQGPLVRVSFGNLIKNSVGSGLLGYVNGFTFDPVLEHGMFNRQLTGGDGKGTIGKQSNEYYPKTFRLNFELNVLHEHDLGFKVSETRTRGRKGKKYSFNDSRLNFTNFPYTIPGEGSGRDSRPGWEKKSSLETPPIKMTKTKRDTNSVAVAKQPALVGLTPTQPALVAITPVSQPIAGGFRMTTVADPKKVGG